MRSVERSNQAAFDCHFDGLSLAYKTTAIRCHQFLKASLLLCVQVRPAIRFQQSAEFLLLTCAQLSLGQGQNLVVGQQFDREINRALHKPIPQDIFQATLCVGRHLARSLCDLFRELEMTVSFMFSSFSVRTHQTTYLVLIFIVPHVGRNQIGKRSLGQG